jgi:hypothetical protein
MPIRLTPMPGALSDFTTHRERVLASSLEKWQFRPITKADWQSRLLSLNRELTQLLLERQQVQAHLGIDES